MSSVGRLMEQLLPVPCPDEKIILLSVDLPFLPTQRSSAVLTWIIFWWICEAFYLGSISEADFLVHTSFVVLSWEQFHATNDLWLVWLLKADSADIEQSEVQQELCISAVSNSMELVRGLDIM